MKKKDSFSPPAMGGSSLLVIFAVLCLTVFALLSVSTVQAERRMADKTAEAVTAYYAADLEAETIFARLRNGQTLPNVTESEGIYAYSCPISEYQTLFVELRRENDRWSVLRWQAVAHPEELHETMPVWNGAP